jgi:hypothetical protein
MLTAVMPVAAQGGSACLQGRVYGAGGSPLMGARVYLLNTGAAVATDVEGRFAFLSLRPDTVSVRVTYIGYKSGMVSGLRLSADKTVTQDFTLEESKVTIGEMKGAPPPARVGNAARPQPPTPLVSVIKCPIPVPEFGEGSYVDKLPVDKPARVLVYLDGVPAADSSMGHIRGLIRDASHRAVANAQVVVVGTMLTTRTDSSGRYLLPRVPPGMLSLRVTRDGFLAAQVEGLRVRRNETILQDFQLVAASPPRP